MSSPCISQNNVWYISLACLYREELHGIHCLRERRYLICFLLNHVLYLQNLQHRPLFALSIRFKKSQQITFISSAQRKSILFPQQCLVVSQKLGIKSHHYRSCYCNRNIFYILMENVKKFTNLILCFMYFDHGTCHPLNEAR